MTTNTTPKAGQHLTGQLGSVAVVFMVAAAAPLTVIDGNMPLVMGLGHRMGTGTAVVALIAYTAIQVGIYGYIGWAIGDTVAFYGGPEVPWPVYALAVLAIVALLDLVIVDNPGPSGLTLESFRPEVFTDGALGIAVLFALTGFIGFEATAVFRDEARDPERTIPRATYAAVLIIGGFYALTCWAAWAATSSTCSC